MYLHLWPESHLNYKGNSWPALKAQMLKMGMSEPVCLSALRNKLNCKCGRVHVADCMIMLMQAVLLVLSAFGNCIITQEAAAVLNNSKLCVVLRAECC